MLSAAEELILLSAGTTARRTAARPRAQLLLEEIEWDRLAESLASMRLLATLGPRILELADVPRGVRFHERVASTLEQGRRRGAFLQLIAQRLIGMLGAAGIRASPLKGPLLGEAIYGDPARRSSSDVDLLVASHQLADATEVVRELGYAAPRDRVGEDDLPLLHFALIHERGGLPPVELHWRVHWYESRFAPERLLAPAGGHTRDWRPAPVDELAALLLFYARDGFLGLRHACDIGAWWDTYGERLHRGEIDGLLASYPALEPAIRTAMAVAERTVGLPRAQIADEPGRLRRRSRIALRLSDPCPRSSPAQQYAQMGLIDGLLSPRHGLRAFVARQLTPPGDAGATGGGSRRGYLTSTATGHGLRVLGRYALALLGLLRLRSPLRSRASHRDRPSLSRLHALSRRSGALMRCR